MEIIKVSTTSVPKSVAGAISARLRDFGEVEVQAVGAKAVNQAIKAIIVTRTYSEKDDMDLVVQPSFTAVDSVDAGIIGIKFYIKQVPLEETED